MGLDMYLYLSKYESEFFNDGNFSKENFYPENLKKFQADIAKRNFVSKETRYQVGYWRKANAIHRFFVEKSGREDDCRDIYVSPNNLIELKKLCEKALKSRDKASEILPTEEGFFFGSTQYDDWYFEDLEYTVELLNDVLNFLKENPRYEIIYRASW